ncbi:hypothetical protein ASF91_13540 [Rhizobium sp. Leaf155]|nr:hypothetical protein ASF91_13540 [Rhizobium sp. Leaf155]
MPALPKDTKSPFAICTTIAVGFSANDPQGTSGQDELDRLLISMFRDGGWERLFDPINQGPQLGCGMGPPPRDLSMIPTPVPPRAPLPICSKSDIEHFLSTYNAVPSVALFKKMVTTINSLDLSKADTVSKLQIARAAVVAGGKQISFNDVVELLAN